MRVSAIWSVALAVTALLVPCVAIYRVGLSELLDSPALFAALVVASSILPAVAGATLGRRRRARRKEPAASPPLPAEQGKRLSRRIAQRESELQIALGIYRELEARLSKTEARLQDLEDAIRPQAALDEELRS